MEGNVINETCEETERLGNRQYSEITGLTTEVQVDRRQRAK